MVSSSTAARRGVSIYAGQLRSPHAYLFECREEHARALPERTVGRIGSADRANIKGDVAAVGFGKNGGVFFT